MAAGESMDNVGTALRMTGVETIHLPNQRAHGKEFTEQFTHGLVTEKETFKNYAARKPCQLIVTDKKIIRIKDFAKMKCISFFLYKDIAEIEQNRSITNKDVINIRFKVVKISY